MKKLSAIITAALCGITLMATACTPTPEGTYTVYAPDGAPALALSKAISEKNEHFTIEIVDSSTTNMASLVSGETPAADFCVLPVNAAAKVLGEGTSYQMLGTVTNGNMYFLTVGAAALTVENYKTELVGKTVGVVQMNNVPGLVFQSVLGDAPYQIMKNDSVAVADKINLKPIANPKTEVSPAGGCDYYLCPEPVASAKVRGTADKPKKLTFAGDLQSLYGEGGYPQAVLVVKKSVIERDKDAVELMLSYMVGAEEYLKITDAAQIAALLAEKRTAGMENPALTADNLTAEVIQNCSVRFTASKDCKEKVNALLAQLIAVNPEFTKTVSDAFFYVD